MKTRFLYLTYDGDRREWRGLPADQNGQPLGTAWEDVPTLPAETLAEFVARVLYTPNI